MIKDAIKAMCDKIKVKDFRQQGKDRYHKRDNIKAILVSLFKNKYFIYVFLRQISILINITTCQSQKRFEITIAHHKKW